MVSAMQKTLAMKLDGYIAAELMVPDPISIRAEATAMEAMTLFTEKGIAAAPVIDEAGRPIGVLSRSDLMVHECAHVKHRGEKPAYFAEPDTTGGPRKASPTMATDLMTPAVFAVSPDTPVHRIIHDMVGLHVHRLFVVDEAGVLVGVISTMDILKHLKPDE